MRHLRQRVLLSLFALALIALAPALPAAAGIHYQAATTTQPAQGKAQTISVEGWVDGEKARVEFTASDNPVMEEGTYMVTQDGGKTLFFVNPKDKTYAEWNLDQMLQTLGSVMQAMGPLLKFEISNVQVTKLGEEAGPTLVGLPTTHTRYRTTYAMKVKVLGMGRSNSIERLQELWTTQSLGEPGLGVWLRNRPMTTGDPDLDAMIAAEMAKVQGFPLKSVEVSTTTDAKKGKQSVSRTETEVVTLDRNAAVPAASFEVPAGYQRTEMMPTGAGAGAGDAEGGEDEKGGNPFKKIFGGGG